MSHNVCICSQPYERFAEIGRVAYIAHGDDKGKLVAIVDVIDQNRVSTGHIDTRYLIVKSSLIFKTEPKVLTTMPGDKVLNFGKMVFHIGLTNYAAYADTTNSYNVLSLFLLSSA